MLRSLSPWIATIAVLVSFALPGYAQQAPAAPAAPAAKPPAKTTVKMKSATGTVKTASADSLVVLVGKEKKEMTFALDQDTKIPKGGKAAGATDLAENDSVTVRYTEAGDKMMAKTVSVKAPKAAAKPKTY